MQDWKYGPPVLIGERVVWLKNSAQQKEGGIVRWIGKLSREAADWTVGIEVDNVLPFGGTDGTWGDRKLFHCDSRRGVFLPLSRIQKEVSKYGIENPADKQKSLERLEGKKGQQEESENNGKRNKVEEKETRRTSLSELPRWINNFNGKSNKESVVEKDINGSSDTDELKSNVQNTRKSVRRRKRRTKSPRAYIEKEEHFSNPRKHEIRRPFSVTDRTQNNDAKDKVNKKHGSCALEAKYIREFIQREIRKQQNSLRGLPVRESTVAEEADKMNDMKGNFKRIDEDDINTYDISYVDPYLYKTPKKYERIQTKILRRSDAFHRREKSNGFFSFLKWFKKSKEMPDLDGLKDSSVTSSPLFIRKRSSSCGSVDTLFSIATANSFAFVSPVQYQAVISSSHTTYPTPINIKKNEDDSKSKNQSDYENSPMPCKDSDKTTEVARVDEKSNTEKRKKCKAPKPPCLVRDISLPNTLEHKKSKEEDFDTKGFHRRSVSESFKDKKAGFYCHVQGKRKAPLPPATAPLYPSLTSLKSQCPSISKKKKPAPQPPEGKVHVIMNKSKGSEEEEKEETMNLTGNKATTSNYDNIPFSNPKSNNPSQNNGSLMTERETPKLKSINLSPLLGLTSDISSSPLPSRPWYKRNSSGSNALKKESMKMLDKRKNKESEDWMPEVGFSRRPISREGGQNIFNLLSRLDKNQDKKKEDKRKSQISILANISELDREAAEIVRKEQAQEKKIIEDMDEKYYSAIFNNNVLSAFPNIQDGAPKNSPVPNVKEEIPKQAESPKKQEKNPFDEFKTKTEPENVKNSGMNNLLSLEAEKSGADAKEEAAKIRNEEYTNAELDYYINPWNCPKCTLENPGWEKFCEACNTMRVKFHDLNAKKESELGKMLSVKGTERVQEMKKSNVTEVKSKELLTKKNKSEELNCSEEPEDPTEDNLEGVRRKRLAFFTSRQSSLRESAATSSLDEDEKLKLKKMLKEMKDSLPKHENGVINNATESKLKDDPGEAENTFGDLFLGFRGKSSGDAEASASAKEFFNAKVQQTQQSNTNDPNKYGAVQKAKPCEPSPTTAEAIIVTKTTIFEDIIVKKEDRGKKVAPPSQTGSSSSNPEGHGRRPGEESSPRQNKVTDHAYANVKNIKENSGVWDLTVPGNTFTNRDIEAMTAKLQQEGAGSADYKVDIQATSTASESNTLNVNRLLKKLESAINSGRHLEAANIAKELAKMKVSCSVKRQKLASDTGLAKITVDLYVEDKLTHKGPIQVAIVPNITLGQLKTKVEKEWDIPRNVQRWILGKQLATEDSKTLEEHGVVSDSCPLFLYIVTTDQTDEQSESSKGPGNVSEPLRTDRRSNKMTEARRPSLIMEEDENGCESAEGDNRNLKPDHIIENKTPEVVADVKENTNSPEKQSLGTPSAIRRESFQRRNSFEKREMSEILKKELKVISTNSVKDRIEKLNRAANGCTAEPSETHRSGWKCKNDDRPEMDRNATEKWHYNELIELENADIVANVEEFECPVCMADYKRGEGVVLRDCLHIFCRTCLVNTIKFNEEAEVKCPYRDDNYSCESVLQQREIKSTSNWGKKRGRPEMTYLQQSSNFVRNRFVADASTYAPSPKLYNQMQQLPTLVPKGIFEQHLAKSVSLAENNIGNAYHCKTPDCKGWCILEDNVNEFRCPVCKKVNCLTCQSIHTGMNCRQYQEQIQFTSDTNAESKKTRDMLQEMVEKGEAMACPTCQVVLMKKWGCDWLRCSMCKTEICWVTRGPRWGPGGKGDNSGGCQCGVNGIKCHPKCNYCH